MDEGERRRIMIGETISEFEMAVYHASRNKGETFVDFFGIPYFDNLVEAGLIEKTGTKKTDMGDREEYRVTRKGIDFLLDIERRQAAIAIGEYEKIFGGP